MKPVGARAILSARVVCVAMVFLLCAGGCQPEGGWRTICHREAMMRTSPHGHVVLFSPGEPAAGTTVVTWDSRVVYKGRLPMGSRLFGYHPVRFAEIIASPGEHVLAVEYGSQTEKVTVHVEENGVTCYFLLGLGTEDGSLIEKLPPDVMFH